MTSFHGLRMGPGLAVITSVSCQGPLRKFTVDHSSPLAMLSPWPLVRRFCFPVLVWCLETLRLDETSLRPFLGPKLFFWLLTLSCSVYCAEFHSTWNCANMVFRARTGLWAWLEAAVPEQHPLQARVGVPQKSLKIHKGVP